MSNSHDTVGPQDQADKRPATSREIGQHDPVLTFFAVLKAESPYILMLLMAIGGIALITFMGKSASWYWQFLTVVYCVICIFVGWGHAKRRSYRIKLIWTQILHWAAFLAAMWLIYSPSVRALVDINASGLDLMVILALATFVAGVHAQAWQICGVGLILALFVPAMAAIQRDSLFVMVAMTAIAFVAASLWAAFHAHRRGSAQ